MEIFIHPSICIHPRKLRTQSLVIFQGLNTSEGDRNPDLPMDGSSGLPSILILVGFPFAPAAEGGCGAAPPTWYARTGAPGGGTSPPSSSTPRSPGPLPLV